MESPGHPSEIKAVNFTGCDGIGEDYTGIISGLKDDGGTICRSSLNHREPCLLKRIHCHCANVWVSLDKENAQLADEEVSGSSMVATT